MPSWGVLCDDARRQIREHKTVAILTNFNAVDVQMKRLTSMEAKKLPKYDPR